MCSPYYFSGAQPNQALSTQQAWASANAAAAQSSFCDCDSIYIVRVGIVLCVNIKAAENRHVQPSYVVSLRA